MNINVTINMQYSVKDSLSLVKKIKLLKDNFDCKIKKSRTNSRYITIDQIIKVVCNYYDMDFKTFQSKSQKREIVQARQIAMYFSKNFTKSSLATIGTEIGMKDHATVLHACKTVNNLMDTDRKYRREIEDIKSRL